MFNPVLKERGTTRLVYSTSVGFRIVGFGTAVVILLSIAAVSREGYFSRANIFPFIMAAVCLFAGLSLERWTFDKDANLLEKSVGLLFIYSRKTSPLDALVKVVLHEQGSSHGGVMRWTSRRTAMLSLVDREARVHRLDLVSGGSVREARRSAERLSAFCAIPFEDVGGDPAEETRP